MVNLKHLIKKRRESSMVTGLKKKLEKTVSVKNRNNSYQ